MQKNDLLYVINTRYRFEVLTEKFKIINFCIFFCISIMKKADDKVKNHYVVNKVIQLVRCNEFLSENIYIYTKPVSYTHLDVYKRQVLRLRKFKI